VSLGIPELVIVIALAVVAVVIVRRLVSIMRTR
jgi:hypothetical protein